MPPESQFWIGFSNGVFQGFFTVNGGSFWGSKSHEKLDEKVGENMVQKRGKKWPKKWVKIWRKILWKFLLKIPWKILSQKWVIRFSRRDDVIMMMSWSVRSPSSLTTHAYRACKLTHTHVWPSASSSSQRRIPRRSGVLDARWPSSVLAEILSRSRLCRVKRRRQ